MEEMEIRDGVRERKLRVGEKRIQKWDEGEWVGGGKSCRGVEEKK